MPDLPWYAIYHLAKLQRTASRCPTRDMHVLLQNDLTKKLPGLENESW